MNILVSAIAFYLAGIGFSFGFTRRMVKVLDPPVDFDDPANIRALGFFIIFWPLFIIVLMVVPIIYAFRCIGRVLMSIGKMALR